MDEDAKCKSVPHTWVSRRGLTSRKWNSLNDDARQVLKKGFQVDAYEERSILVNHIYIAEILASFGEDRFLLSKGKLRIILEKKHYQTFVIVTFIRNSHSFKYMYPKNNS